MHSNHLVIAIDGPAGAGKSTVSKLLANELGLSYLDTGAMYRALALKASRNEIPGDAGQEAAELLSNTEITFGIGDPPPIFLDGEDVSHLIRTPQIGELASALSAHVEVRKALVSRQQALVAQGNVILEGRDATTVIAPTATVKVYMTASLEERAKRRHIEFSSSGFDRPFEQVRSDIEQRDHRDITRDESPLSVAADAYVVETAGRTPEEIAEIIKSLVPSG